MAYETIHHANLYYALKGYQKVHAPWIVEEKFSNITKPPEKRNFPIPGGSPNGPEKVLVASGEQSFLEMIEQKKISPGVFYQTTTPCFRDEIEDDLHQKYFLKTELIYFELIENDPQQIDRIKQKANTMIDHCLSFFNQYLPAQVIHVTDPKPTLEHFYLSDIVSSQDQIELGSYGIRRHQKIVWVYGTGCAEPRLSYAAGHGIRPGYHLDLIGKTRRIGSVEKIIEEYNEFLDSLKQGTSVMELVELSDLIGAIDLYLKKHHNKSINDLILFSEITQRAFLNGRRS